MRGKVLLMHVVVLVLFWTHAAHAEKTYRRVRLKSIVAEAKAPASKAKKSDEAKPEKVVAISKKAAAAASNVKADKAVPMPAKKSAAPSLESTLQELQKKSEKDKAKIAELTKLVTTLEVKVSTVEKVQVASLTKQISELQEQSEKDEVRIVELTNLIEKFQAQTKLAEQAQVESQKKAELLEQKSTEDKAKIAELKALVEALQKETEELRAAKAAREKAKLEAAEAVEVASDSARGDKLPTEVDSEMLVARSDVMPMRQALLEPYALSSGRITAQESNSPLLAVETPEVSDPVEPAEESEDDLWSRDSLTGGFWGLNDSLANHGIEVAFGTVSVYQQNARGGVTTYHDNGAHTGSYDLEIAADFEKLLGFEGAGLFVHIEGGWPDAEGIDGASVGSVMGINGDAGGNRTMDVAELFYEGNIFSDALTIMAGKMDFAGVFDASEFANDEGAQFISGGLVNNATIPLPEYCLGLIMTWQASDWLSISAGAGDAQTDPRETGFRTAFHKEDYFFYILEGTISKELMSAKGPLPGNYRFGVWNDPQPKANSDMSRNYRDDVGVYTSFDQLLSKENDDPEDSQGLGVFGRYGYARPKTNDIEHFWSAGLQYQGLIDGRDDDVLGLGYAKGIFSDSANATYTQDYESLAELYYNIQCSPWLSITPHVQYLTNPGGVSNVTDSVVVGVRAAVAF
jgi:porin